MNGHAAVVIVDANARAAIERPQAIARGHRRVAPRSQGASALTSRNRSRGAAATVVENR
jgi:hypothetical protein